jgi:hypothetical protein
MTTPRGPPPRNPGGHRFQGVRRHGQPGAQPHHKHQEIYDECPGQNWWRESSGAHLDRLHAAGHVMPRRRGRQHVHHRRAADHEVQLVVSTQTRPRYRGCSGVSSNQSNGDVPGGYAEEQLPEQPRQWINSGNQHGDHAETHHAARDVHAPAGAAAPRRRGPAGDEQPNHVEEDQCGEHRSKDPPYPVRAGHHGQPRTR